jgi:hypothetical protein
MLVHHLKSPGLMFNSVVEKGEYVVDTHPNFFGILEISNSPAIEILTLMNDDIRRRCGDAVSGRTHCVSRLIHHEDRSEQARSQSWQLLQSSNPRSSAQISGKHSAFHRNQYPTITAMIPNAHLTCASG